MLVLDGITFLASSAWLYQLASSVEFESINRALPRSSSAQGLAVQIRSAASEWATGFKAAVQNKAALRHMVSQGVVGVAHGLLAASTIGHHKTTLNVSDSKVALAQTNNRVWQIFGAIFAMRTKLSADKLLFIGGLLMAVGYAGMSVLPFAGFLLAYGTQQLGNAILAPTNRAMSLIGSTSQTRGRIAAFRSVVIDVGVLLGNVFATWIIGSAGTRWSFALAALLMLSIVSGQRFLTSNVRELRTTENESTTE